MVWTGSCVVPRAIKESASEPQKSGSSKAARKVWLLIIMITILLPWVVGASMKIYLDFGGYPTFPWLYFLDPLSLPLLILMIIWWGLPMIIVAFIARYALANPGDYFSHKDLLLIITFTVVAGFGGMVKVFLPVFRDYDPMYVIVPLFFYYFHWIVAGFILGLVVAYLSVFWRKHW